MIRLKHYEREYGNGGCVSLEDAQENMRVSLDLLQQRYPDGVWTQEPHIVVGAETPGYRTPVGWYGIFAPLGIVEIPDGVDVDA